MHIQLLETVAAHRAERAHHRQLAAELAAYSSPSDRTEIESIIERYSDEETRELRGILAVQAAA